jgi:hypothetical protein
MEHIIDQMNDREIAESTKKLYVKKLEMLHKGCGTDEDDYQFLKDTEKVLGWISQFKSAKRRSLYNSALVGLSPASKTEIPQDVAQQYNIYRDVMLEENAKVLEGKVEQKKTETEDGNWATIKELFKVVKTYKDVMRVKGYSLKNPPQREKDVDILQRNLVGCLYLAQAPRRLEYGNMVRISKKDYDGLDTEVKESNNYVVRAGVKKMFFSFGDTKVKKATLQTIDLHPKLVNVVRMWYAATPDATSFLLGYKGEPQSCNGLSKYLIGKVFEPTGKKIGASMIRKIYCSEKYEKDTPLKEKMETAALMNHSAGTAEMHYVKKG